jgi:hypothetical protein
MAETTVQALTLIDTRVEGREDVPTKVVTIMAVLTHRGSQYLSAP